MASTDTDTTEEGQSANDTLRRRIVQTFGGLGVVSFAGAMLTPLKGLGIEAPSGTQQISGQVLVLAERYQPAGGGEAHEVGAPVTRSMMSTPDSILTYPQQEVDNNHYLIRLHRLSPEEMAEPTNLDQTADGYVAYSAVCTHLGCTVDWSESDHPQTGNPFDICHCHGSEYDPYEGATVLRPPAPRPLPQIGLEINDEDQVQLTSDFEAKVGP
ncbi:MAG: ubiquinol-cytochrome c reductase iron-sulfur subunit [Halanaeroarchaeum sp.]